MEAITEVDLTPGREVEVRKRGVALTWVKGCRGRVRVAIRELPDKSAKVKAPRMQRPIEQRETYYD